nr:MAG TPA: hypothetical protein [Caudoviricetes sp.]
MWGKRHAAQPQHPIWRLHTPWLRWRLLHQPPNHGGQT